MINLQNNSSNKNSLNHLSYSPFLPQHPSDTGFKFAEEVESIFFETWGSFQPIINHIEEGFLLHCFFQSFPVVPKKYIQKVLFVVQNSQILKLCKKSVRTNFKKLDPIQLGIKVLAANAVARCLMQHDSPAIALMKTLKPGLKAKLMRVSKVRPIVLN